MCDATTGLQSDRRIELNTTLRTGAINIDAKSSIKKNMRFVLDLFSEIILQCSFLSVQLLLFGGPARCASTVVYTLGPWDVQF